MGLLDDKINAATTAKLRPYSRNGIRIAGAGTIIWDGFIYKEAVNLGFRVGNTPKEQFEQEEDLAEYNALEVKDATLIDRIVRGEISNFIEFIDDGKDWNAKTEVVYFGDKEFNIGLRVRRIELKNPSGSVTRGYGNPEMVFYDNIQPLLEADRLVTQIRNAKESKVENDDRFVGSIFKEETLTIPISPMEAALYVSNFAHSPSAMTLASLLVTTYLTGPIIARKTQALLGLRNDQTEYIKNKKQEFSSKPDIYPARGKVVMEFLRIAYGN